MNIDASEKELLLRTMEEMQNRRIRRIFLFATILLIIITLGVTGLLNHASFKQNQSRSLLSGYALLAAESARELGQAAASDGLLVNEEVQQVLNALRQSLPEWMDVQLQDQQGKRMAEQVSLEGEASSRLDASVYSSFVHEDGQNYHTVLHEGKYHLLLPVGTETKKRLGVLELILEEERVSAASGSFGTTLLGIMIGLAVVSTAALIYLISRIGIMNEAGDIRRKRLLTTIFVVLGGVQLLFGLCSYWMHKESLLQTLKFSTEAIVQQHVGRVDSEETPKQLQEAWSRTKEWMPEIKQMTLLSPAEAQTAYSGEEVYSFRLPLNRVLSGQEGYAVHIELHSGVINERMRDMLLDMVTLLVISFVLLVEISLLIMIYLKKKVIPVRGENLTRFDELDRSMVRPLSFLVFAAVHVSTSFIPVLMKERFEPIFGLSETVVLGLPISAEMLCLGLVSTFAGDLIDRKGWKPPFLIGAGIIAIGLGLSAWSDSALLFILARAIVGAGFGFTLMAMQAYTVKAPTEETKNEALTQLNSGAYAGINFGVVVGGIMADRIGFTEVFIVALLLIIGSLLFAWKWMANSMNRHSMVHLDEVLESMGISLPAEEKPSKARSLVQFLWNREIVQLFLLILLPISVCGMFVGYFFPVYAESIGISPSDVGRIILLNGLCIVFLGPYLSRVSEQRLGVRTSFTLSNLLVVGALLVFALYSNLWTAVAAVILFGVAEGVGITAQINYYISRRATGELGEGKAMGIYSLMENIGQMLGPIAYGSAAAFGMSLGVGSIGVSMLALLLLFILLAGRGSKRQELNDLHVR